MYNHYLEMVKKFGQENSTVPFYFPPEIDNFFVCNQYFIIYELVYKNNEFHNNVTIINRSNGLVESSFIINEGFKQIRLYLDKFLITFGYEILDNDNETCFLKCYNFKGDLLHSITLDEKLEGSDIYVINKELCFKLENEKFLIS